MPENIISIYIPIFKEKITIHKIYSGRNIQLQLLQYNAYQAFKILRADSCTSDVETRIKFQKMDKSS